MRADVDEAERKALRPVPPVEPEPGTGLGVVRLGRPVSSHDVEDALDDHLAAAAARRRSHVATFDHGAALLRPGSVLLLP